MLIFLFKSAVSRMTPLYTAPNPPSPMTRERLKFLVAVFSSANVNTLRLFDLGDKLLIDNLLEDSSCELKSDPDLVTSGRVDMEVEEGSEADFVVLGSLSLLENEKHFIGPKVLLPIPSLASLLQIHSHQKL